MDNKQLRRQHIQTFKKLSLSERLDWAFSQAQFLSAFRDRRAKLIDKNIRRNAKRYFPS